MVDSTATFETLEQLKVEISQQINSEQPNIELTIFKIVEYRQLLLKNTSNNQLAEQLNQELEWLNQQVELINDLKAAVMAEISQLNRARKANASYDTNK